MDSSSLTFATRFCQNLHPDITSTDGTKEVLERYVNHPQVIESSQKRLTNTDLHREFRLK